MIDEFELCTKRDEFIWDKVCWVATLADGTEVWQDDDRQGVSEPSAWIRLKNYVNSSGNKISKLQLRFRSNIITLQPSPAYYFTKGVLKGTSMSRCIHFACVGYLDDENVFNVTWYKIPELLPQRMTFRKLEEIHGQEMIEGTNGKTI